MNWTPGSTIRRTARARFKTAIAPLFTLALLLADIGSSHAQNAPATGSTRPQQAMEEPPVPRSVPESTVPLFLEQMAPEAAADVVFTFQQLRLEGATALPEEVLRAAWPHEPGTSATVADVFRFADAVTRIYDAAGYALSFGLVPEQQIEDGIVTVRIVEGFVDNIEFIGEETEQLQGSAVLRKAERIAVHILDSRPLRTADLERYVLLVDDLPGLQVATSLMASPAALGGSTLRIAVTERRPVEVQLGFNNSLPESLQRDIFGGSVQANGLMTGATTLRLGGWYSADSDIYHSASADLATVVGTQGLTLGLSGFYSESDPEGDLLSALEYLGRTAFISAYANFPVLRTRSRNLTLGVSVGLSDTETEILSIGLTEDKLRTVEAYATYDFADRTGAVNYFRLGLEQGIDTLDAIGNSRANGDLEYTVATLDIQSDRPLFILSAGSLAVRLQLRGQATVGSNAVFSAAECGYGGRQFGRGFDPATLLGDHCVLGSAELRWTGPIGAANGDIYAFADGGIAYQKGALVAGEARDRKATSAGAGFRLRFSDRVYAAVEAAWPMKDPRDNQVQIDDFRLNASLRFDF